MAAKNKRKGKNNAAGKSGSQTVRLDLSGKGYKWGIWHVEEAGQWESHPNLEVLDLSGNDIDFLPYSIGKLESLRELNLANNDLQYWARHDQWPLSQISCPNLEILNLSGNDMGYIVIPHRTAYRETLRELDLVGKCI